MFDFLGVGFLLLLVFVLGWLTKRAWRTKRMVIKWLGAIISGLLTLVVSVFLCAALFGYWKLNRTYNNPVSKLTVAVTSEQVARGAKFHPFCAGCHSPDNSEALIGSDFLEEDAPPIGNFYAPNLTPIHLADWSDGEIIRAIREGIHRNGRSLLIMPSDLLHNLSDDDVQSIVAYLRSLSAEGSKSPRNKLNILGAVMSNVAPIFQVQPAITEQIISPPAGPTANYGAYLSSFTCAGCHGPDLLGDVSIPAPPLLVVPVDWSEQEFISFMHTGERPNGTNVDGELMPWEFLSQLFNEDDELRAIYAYLKEIEVQYNLEH